MLMFSFCFFNLAWCLSCRCPHLLPSFVDMFFHSCLLSFFLLSPCFSFVYKSCFFSFGAFHCLFSNGFSSVFADGSTLGVSLATCICCPAWIGTSVLADYIRCRLSVSCLLCSQILKVCLANMLSCGHLYTKADQLCRWCRRCGDGDGSTSSADCAANATAASMHRGETILRSNVQCPSAITSLL